MTFCYGICFGGLIVIILVNYEEKNKSIIENEEEEIYQINILNEVPYNVNIGESVSIDLNIMTPESYKFEATPFILYSAYFDEEQWEWIQIDAFRLSAGEENYSLHIDTDLLGLSDGKYMISFDLFKSSDYAEGRSLTNKSIILNLSGDCIYYDNDVYDRNVITYEKITDVFVIDGVAYSKKFQDVNI